MIGDDIAKAISAGNRCGESCACKRCAIDGDGGNGVTRGGGEGIGSACRTEVYGSRSRCNCSISSLGDGDDKSVNRKSGRKRVSCRYVAESVSTRNSIG